MISVAYSDIPVFLHSGAFYHSLSADEPDSVIEVPEDCFVTSTLVGNVADFARSLRTVNFWMLEELPETCIEYMFTHLYEEWEETAREVLEQSAQTGLCDVIQNLFYLPDESLAEAIRSGRADFVRYLVNTAPTDCQATREAAESGRLDFLQLLRAHNHPWDETATCAAASGGHLDCLKYLHNSGCPWNERLYCDAIQHTDCCVYAHLQGLAWPESIGELISSRGDVALLLYALQHGITVDAQTVTNAAAEGNVGVLRYLLETGYQADERTYNSAITNNHVSCLRVLREYNVPWDSGTTSVAAFFNLLPVLQYLHENGCPWDSVVTERAAGNGCIETLRYAIDHGCPYDVEKVMLQAASAVSGSLACLQYLVGEKNLPILTDGAVFVSAFARGDLACIEYLMLINCPNVPTTPRAQECWNDIGTRAPYGGFSIVDMNIARCIEHATSHGWDLQIAGAGLVVFMNRNKGQYPLSYALCSGL